MEHPKEARDHLFYLLRHCHSPPVVVLHTLVCIPIGIQYYKMNYKIISSNGKMAPTSVCLLSAHDRRVSRFSFCSIYDLDAHFCQTSTEVKTALHHESVDLEEDRMGLGLHLGWDL